MTFLSMFYLKQRRLRLIVRVVLICQLLITYFHLSSYCFHRCTASTANHCYCFDIVLVRELLTIGTDYQREAVSALEVCGYSIFATRPVPVAQDRYPYPYPTRTQNYYPTRPVHAGIPVPVRPSLSSVPMHIVYVR